MPIGEPERSSPGKYGTAPYQTVVNTGLPQSFGFTILLAI
jgi:hypothetical protein